MRVLRSTAAALVAAAVVSGCGGDGAPARPAATPVASVPLSSCNSPAWKPLHVGDLEASAAGSGRLGVVFVNESGNVTCSWTGEGADLVRHGYRVATFSFSSVAHEWRDALAVGRALGTPKVVLIGASVGGRAVLQAAARRPRALAGVVSISGERTVTSDQHDLLPTAAKVRLPVLLIGSRGDGYTTFGADTRALHRVIPGDRMLMVPGVEHGTDLFARPTGAAVRAAILRFLSARSSPGPA